MTSSNSGTRLNFENKTALITGGVGTLGRCFAERLLQSGANVVLVDVKKEELEASISEFATDFRGKVSGISCDVSEAAEVVDMVGKANEVFGGVDILLNNASYSPNDGDGFFAPFEEYTLDQWRRVMEVNIDGMFLVAQAVGREMIAQERTGNIVQMSSVYGVLASDKRIYEGSHYRGRPINNPAVYSTSKAAVIGFTKWLAAHWADHGIRVNAVAPGGVEDGQNDTFNSLYSNRVPIKRMAKAGEVVSTVLYLASDEASYITGQCLLVDGGLSVW